MKSRGDNFGGDGSQKTAKKKGTSKKNTSVPSSIPEEKEKTCEPDDNVGGS